MNDLSTRLSKIRDRIEAARAASGLDQEVTLVAVTKGQPVETVERAIEAGLREIAENRVEEMEAKVARLQGSEARWHFVGRLQRRQSRTVLRHADLIQSVHATRLAEAISRRAEDESRLSSILVQVNTSGEDRKAGLRADAALEELRTICDLPGIRVLGLMTMAPFTGDEAVIRSTFRKARRLFETAADIPGFEPRHLSMGMSNDYPVAVEEGSTMVRLGTVLFGPRSND